MNNRGKITAATGSMVLNVALVLLMSQGLMSGDARASTQAMRETAPEPVAVAVHRMDGHPDAAQHCRSAARTRAWLAVLLGMIV